MYNDCNSHVEKSDKLAIADFNFKDMDRFRTFYNIAKENGRKLVININDTLFLEKLSQDPQLNLPKPDDENILIYKPKKTIWKTFEKQYLENTNALTAEELVEKQEKLLCAFWCNDRHETKIRWIIPTFSK